MKHSFIHFILFSIVSLTSTKINSQNLFVFKAIFPPEFNGKTVSLKIEDNYSQDKYQNTYQYIITNNQAYLKGTLKNVAEYATLSILLNNRYHFHYLIIDSGITTAKILPVSRNSPTFRNKLSNIEFLKSPSNNLVNIIDSLRNSYYTKYGERSKNSLLIDLSKENRIKLEKRILHEITIRPTMYSSLIHLYKLSKRDIIEPKLLLDVFQKFSENIQTSNLGKGLNSLIKTKISLQPGNKIPLFTTINSTNQPFINKSLIGKPYLLAFGATWCKPCKEDYPFLKDLYKKYKPYGVEIVGINIDDNRTNWLTQLKAFNIPWIYTSVANKAGEKELSELFDIKKIPFYILVNKEGTIIYNSISTEDTSFNLLQEILKKELKN